MNKKQVKFLQKIIIIILLINVVMGLLLFQQDDKTITIGTKNLTEQRIIAFMLQEVIERDTDYNVQIKSGMDSTSFVQSAIVNNDIDMYVEYSSSAYMEIFKQQYNGQTNDEIIDYITTEYKNEYNLSWISTLGFDNSNTIICSSFCKENNITTYSELSNCDFSFAALDYFFSRSDGYNLLEETYGFSNNVDKEKMDASLIYVAIENGSVDAGLAFTTDAKLNNEELVVLEDGLNVFPSYDAGIVVSNESLDKYPEIKDILMSFDNKFNDEIIRQANYEVEIEHKSAKDVAHELVVELEL